MNQRRATKILIEHSFLLPEAVKNKLLGSLDKLSDHDVYAIGRFLAIEKKKSLQKSKQMIREIDEMLKKIENKTVIYQSK